MKHGNPGVRLLDPLNSKIKKTIDWVVYRTCFRWCAAMMLIAVAQSPASLANSPASEARDRLLAQAEPRLKAIYESDELRMRSFQATWLPNSSGYLKLETPEGASASEIARYDSVSGQRTVFVGGDLLVPGTKERLKLHRFVCSPTGQRLLLHTEGSGGSDRWLYESESGDLRPVKAGDGVRFEADAFSPDGQRLLGSRGADLIVYDIASGQITPLTRDGDSDAIHNDRAIWSPDGQWIAYVQSDSSAVPKRQVIVPGDPTYRTFEETRFERIGGPIPILRIGVVDVAGGPTRWVELADQPGTFYMNTLGWAGNSDEVLIDKLSRGRDVREVLLASPRTGAITKAYSATDPAWVVSWVDMEPGGLEWVRGSETFILFSERDGWRRAYVVPRDGTDLGKRFDYFVYPNRDHGLSEGEGTAVHVQMLVIRHLIEHLPPGPR